MLDSTELSLCLKIFGWAKYKQGKDAIRLHTMLDYDECFPSFIQTSENAIWTQSARGGWTALISLLLLSYLRETAKYGWGLSNLIALLRMILKDYIIRVVK